MAQLVGRNCVHCGGRISNDLDSRFCRGCGSPVHDRCVRPSGGKACPVCGAARPPAPAPAHRFDPRGVRISRARGWRVAGPLAVLGLACLAASTNIQVQEAFGPAAQGLGGAGGLLLIGACSVLAAAKGRSPLWGAAGLLCCAGLALVAALPGAREASAEPGAAPGPAT